MDREDFTKKIKAGNTEYVLFDINRLEAEGMGDVQKLPFSIKILAENLLRKLDGKIVTPDDIQNIAGWAKKYNEPVEIPFYPARVLMQDFTGVPVLVDLAAMRDAVKELGGDSSIINPLLPVDLIVDHSIQIDYYGNSKACLKNVELEYMRNQERYSLLKWAQENFDNFRVVPPNSGICHQINLEYIGNAVLAKEEAGQVFIYPDTLVGTDSHTTMINSIGVLGWGVGGIEAEAVMLGQPYYMPIPEVYGVKIIGSANKGCTAADIVLGITEMLRKSDVVGKFVEFFGLGIKNLSVPDRSTISNMAPEYGATIGFFPTDEKTVKYLKLTGREKQAELVEIYTKEQGLFYNGTTDPEYTRILEFDLSLVEPAIAGPAKPQERILLKGVKRKFNEILKKSHGAEVDPGDGSKSLDNSGDRLYKEAFFEPVYPLTSDFGIQRNKIKIRDGSIVIAAITSCTNTSNPFAMMGAGLLAKKAVKAGVRVSPFVKTSLAPGSKVVIEYLKSAGLIPYLEALGFHLAGYGCTTCIGNSGPLYPGIETVISEKNLNVVSVLSGNRNFEARINQHVRSNFLMSPMLVVAFAIAGRIDMDFEHEPIAVDSNCDKVFLKDILPTEEEIKDTVEQNVKPELFKRARGEIFRGDSFWHELQYIEGVTFKWDKESIYIKRPPFFDNFTLDFIKPSNVMGARVLLLLGDTVTTDHISPAGAIPETYPAGKYLTENGLAVKDFNSYGSRRGNHDVMIRGSFGNVRIKNRITKGEEGSFTLKFPENKKMFIYDAAVEYAKSKTPLIVIAGKEYGTGSSRDWAAKGTSLLGVKAVIAESYERIHRSNLVGMGVLPLQFVKGDTAEKLGLKGDELFDLEGIAEISPGKKIKITSVKSDNKRITFEALARLDTDIEVEYFKNGGILQYVLRHIIKKEQQVQGGT